MKSKGTAAEGILLKMFLHNGIEAEHGSPSRPGDIIVLPNVIIEIKDPNANSFSFRDHAAKGESQWRVLKEKTEKFPWLEIYYIIRFKRKEWRYFTFPEKPEPLRLKKGLDLSYLFPILFERQHNLSIDIVGGS